MYIAWTVIHAALALAAVYASGALDTMSGPWLEGLDWLETEEIKNPDEQTLEILGHLRAWIPAQTALAGSVARRATWFALACIAWVPVLLFESRRRPRPSRTMQAGSGSGT